MKTKTILLTLLLSANVLLGWSADFLNVTPKPKSVTTGTGRLQLPIEFTIGTDGLTDDMIAEARRFASLMGEVAGFNIQVKNDTTGTLFALYPATLTSLGTEGYKLSVTANKVLVSALTADGFYYAFQTIKKMLPANVMAEVQDAAVTDYSLPVVEISDAPRFGYRGFMLDVARHFFPVSEVKRMLDVMSYYKMNRFHWHLTDDQGWRIEIKKYPKLTTVGSVRSTSYSVDPVYGRYNDYAQYGPYFYTQEEIKEVVAYAKERHIEIIPEVEMPGHVCAMLASYPEVSCSPNGSHSVQTDGGIYSDVMNVGSDVAIQFAKDILDELTTLFPYSIIHMGGDECPSGAWSSNSECKAVMEAEGLTDVRMLQSRFIKILSDYMANKPNESDRRTLMAWNEAISASGTDIEVMKSTNITVMCWQPCDASALKAAQMGLKCVVTPYGPYYINRKQSTDPGEPVGAGSGSDNLESVYAYTPIPTANKSYSKFYIGVQGTFWAEHVQSKYLLEYLALPRLMAVAETGWSIEGNKNFEDFRQRITADSVLLNYNGYDYGRHYMKSTSTEMVMPKNSENNKWNWYQLITRNTGDANRKGKCIELLREGASQLSSNTSKVNRLWSGVVTEAGSEAYDYQLWAVKEDPERSGYYALVCKAKPNGSVNTKPTAENNTGRWDYDDTTLHYDFVLGDKAYSAYNDNYCYSIRSSKVSASLWVNMAASGQYYSINLWNDPNDGNSGLWEFNPVGMSGAADTIAACVAEATTLLGQITLYSNEAEMHPGRYSKVKADHVQTLMNAIDSIYALPESQLSVVAADFHTALEELRNSAVYLQEGEFYRFTNTSERFPGLTLCDAGKGSLMTSTDRWAQNGWTATSTSIADGKQQLKLKNALTGKFINGSSSPLSMGTSGANYYIQYSPALGDFTLNSGESALFPISASYYTNAGMVYVGGIRPQGTGWNIEPVAFITYRCIDEENKLLGMFTETAAKGESYKVMAPEITNYATAPVESEFAVTKSDTIEVVYSRTGYTVTFRCTDSNGAILMEKSKDFMLGETVNIEYPSIPYYEFEQSDWTGESAWTPDKDVTINVIYTTDALTGFNGVGETVTAIKEGCYLLYDATSASGRTGYLNVSPDNSIIYTTDSKTEGTPLYIWTIEKNGSSYTVKNGGGKYIPNVSSGSNITASNSAGRFTFTLNSDGETWSVKGTNNLYWNGNAGSFTGWSDAHPYRICTFNAVPYYTVACSFVDESGTVLGNRFDYVQAGNTYSLSLPSYEGLAVAAIEGDTIGLNQINTFHSLTVHYSDATSISSAVVNEDYKTGRIYDLSGRRIEKITRQGIYIMDGKKIHK